MKISRWPTEHPACDHTTLTVPISDYILDELLADEGGFADVIIAKHRVWWEEEDECREDLPELSHRNIIIVAKYPGAGKSSLSKRYARRYGQVEATLFVCPTNDLRDNYLEEGFHAITLHTCVGRGGRNGVDGASKPYPVQGFTRVVFEEAFLYATIERSWLVKYICGHESISFVANGDPRQNKPVSLSRRSAGA